jgi:hypothetical protein
MRKNSFRRPARMWHPARQQSARGARLLGLPPERQACCEENAVPRIDPDKIPPALWKQMNISKERFQEIMAEQQRREANVPAVGSEAPDFELKRLDEKGTLTETTLRLSALRGRPVGLVFGSYT